jgi:hypothetical protein
MASKEVSEEEAFKVHQLIGRALWAIQEFEETLTRFIALMERIPARASFEEARKILSGIRTDTLGKLVRQTKQITPFDEDFEMFMQRFVQQRNWLVHRSHLTHGIFEYDCRLWYDLRLRVRGLEDDAKELNAFFKSMINDYLLERGIKPEELEQLADPDDDYADRSN